jgi:hypothetical protein
LLLRYCLQRLRATPRVVELPPLRDHKESLVVVGDLHGQLPDLDALFQRVGYPSALNRFVFNGDFVDRGESSVEVVCVLLAYLLALPPGAVHLNRGNHEDRLLAQVYGFRAELAHKYGEPDAQQLYDSFVQLFEALPLLAVLREADGARHGDERGGGGGGGLAIVHAGLPLSREGAGMGVPELAAALRSVPHSHGLLDSVIGEKEQEQEEEEEALRAELKTATEAAEKAKNELSESMKADKKELEDARKAAGIEGKKQVADAEASLQKLVEDAKTTQADGKKEVEAALAKHQTESADQAKAAKEVRARARAARCGVAARHV